LRTPLTPPGLAYTVGRCCGRRVTGGVLRSVATLGKAGNRVQRDTMPVEHAVSARLIAPKEAASEWLLGTAGIGFRA